jgi:hypothetical protein
MSILSFPRLFFRGLISWDPGLVNNGPDVYDAANVKLILPSGVTYQTFKQWVIDSGNGGWNYYGTHTCEFPESKTLITGGNLSPSGSLVTTDPLVGKPVQFGGKLVDLGPATSWTSQIYFDSFSFGDGQAGVSSERYHRMHSRWINGQRNLGGLPIAGGVAVVWQTVFPRDQLHLSNSANSPLLKALEQAMQQADAQGLMLRFCTYSTVYYQNGILNDIPQQPRTAQELHDLYRQGEIFSNPAYSLVVGAIGVWNRGELVSAPGGRYLAPGAPVTPTNPAAADAVRLGSCVAEFDRPRSLISLDFNSTIPEIDSSLAKASFGPLTLAVRQAGTVTPISTIAVGRYDRAAYENSAGIIDIPVAPDLLDKIEVGELILQVQQDGQSVAALTEAKFLAQVDERDNYLNEAAPVDVKIHVSHRGKPAPPGTRVLIARYDANRQRLAAGTATPQVLQVGPDGTVALSLLPQAPGFVNIGLFPFAPSDPQPIAPVRLDVTGPFFLCVRTLPFDNQLEAQTPDSQLTWSFVYENILRTYDLLNPVMSAPDIGLPLNDKSVWTTPGRAKLLKLVTADNSFEEFNHMPVTRELSAGKRKLLHRFCDLVINGTLPADGPSPLVEPEPDLLPLRDFRREL